MSETTRLQVFAWVTRHDSQPNVPLNVMRQRPAWWKGEADVDGYEAVQVTPLLPAQEALAQAESRVREMEDSMERLTESLAESETELLEAEHRLERVRPVVRDLLLFYESDHPELWDLRAAEAVDALTLEDRAWAEGVPEEEG